MLETAEEALSRLAWATGLVFVVQLVVLFLALRADGDRCSECLGGALFGALWLVLVLILAVLTLWLIMRRWRDQVGAGGAVLLTAVGLGILVVAFVAALYVTGNAA